MLAKVKLEKLERGKPKPIKGLPLASFTSFLDASLAFR